MIRIALPVPAENPRFFLPGFMYGTNRGDAPLGENCFHLAAGESVTFCLYQFDHAAQDERGLHDALQWVYGRFHEPPRRLCTVKETVAAIVGAIKQGAWLPESHGYVGGFLGSCAVHG